MRGELNDEVPTLNSALADSLCLGRFDAGDARFVENGRGSRISELTGTYTIHVVGRSVVLFETVIGEIGRMSEC